MAGIYKCVPRVYLNKSPPGLPFLSVDLNALYNSDGQENRGSSQPTHSHNNYDLTYRQYSLELEEWEAQ